WRSIMLQRSCTLGAALIAVTLITVAALPAPAPARAATQVPNCLTGSWMLADPASYAQALNTILGQAGTGLQVTGVSGSAVLTIQPDGTYAVTYDQFTAMINAIGAFTFQGTIRGVFRETDPGYLTGSVTESSLAATISFAGVGTMLPLDFTTPE